MNKSPHALNCVGPAGSRHPVHHKVKCVDAGLDAACRGCYPHTNSIAGIAELAKRKGGRIVHVRAVVEVGS